MRIGLVSPRFPPRRCGVGDYTAQLAAELVKQGHDVEVWTKVTNATPLARVGIRPFSLRTFIREVRATNVDVVVFQYTSGSFYSRSSVLIPWFEALVVLLRLIFPKLRVVLNAHEVRYPIQFNFRGAFRGIPDFLHFFCLGHLCHEILFTYEASYTEWCRRLVFSGAKLRYLPIFSNIPPARTSTLSLKDKLGFSARQRILLHFGGSHPTHLFDYMAAALSECLQVLGEDRVALVCIGIDQETLEAKLREAGYPDLHRRAFGLGFVGEAEVSNWHREADLALAPFMDGISTRRGSAMAAFAHGTPVATTLGWASEGAVGWSDFCKTVVADAPNSKKIFAEEVRKLLELPVEERKRLGELGQKYYEANFSVTKVAQLFLAMISS